MDNEQAAELLHKLLEIPGFLRIITNEHACGGGAHPSLPWFDSARCEGCEYPLTDPRHFVIHDVARIEGPDKRGRYKVHSAEGDWCQGQPQALYARLTEAGPRG